MFVIPERGSMAQFFKVFITVINILWILAALCALFFTKERDKGITFLNCTLLYTMLMNLIEIWKA